MFEKTESSGRAGKVHGVALAGLAFLCGAGCWLPQDFDILVLLNNGQKVLKTE